MSDKSRLHPECMIHVGYVLRVMSHTRRFHGKFVIQAGCIENRVTCKMCDTCRLLQMFNTSRLHVKCERSRLHAKCAIQAGYIQNVQYKQRTCKKCDTSRLHAKCMIQVDNMQIVRYKQVSCKM